MTRFAPLAATALGLALAACGPVNRGLDSVHQPVVSRADYSLDVTATASGLAAGEDRRLEAWFDSVQLGYGDRIAIDDPDPYAAEAHREAVAAVAAARGLLLDRTAPVTAGAAAPGTVRVVVSRSSASVGPCPDWRRASQPDFEASTTSNYGCASNTNLAQMVANPQDLVAGQTGRGIGDARSVTKAIKTYRDLAPTGGAALEKTGTGGK